MVDPRGSARPVGSGAQSPLPRCARTSGSSSSTAPSAPRCRATTSAPTTSAARPSRAATRSCAHPARRHRRDARRVLRGRRRRGRDRHLRRLRRSCSPSTASPSGPTSSTSPRPRIASEVADGYSTPDRPRFVAGSIGPGTKLAVARPDPLRRAARRLRGAGARAARGRRRRAPHRDRQFDLLQAKAAMIGCRRAMAAAGRDGAAQVQVTIETTGRMLVGTEIGAALTALDAMRPDVIGINCATGPAEMSEHLRYLVAARAHVPISCLPNAGPAVGRRRPDALRPHARAARRAHDRFVTELGVNVVGGCCGTTPEHLAPVVDAVQRPHAGARARRSTSPARRRSTRTCRSTRSSRTSSIGERTNANGSQEVPRRDARRRLGHLRADGHASR